MRERILEIFKKQKTPVNGFVMNRVFSTFIRTLNPREQDEFPTALQGLLDEGYIETRDGDYILTQEGYNYIYRDYTLNETEEIILNVFREHKIRAGQILMQNTFTILQNRLERIHFDNFNNAINSLITDGLITITPQRHFMLTQNGFEHIY